MFSKKPYNKYWASFDASELGFGGARRDTDIHSNKYKPTLNELLDSYNTAKFLYELLGDQKYKVHMDLMITKMICKEYGL